jgi:hypothetical protein
MWPIRQTWQPAAAPFSALIWEQLFQLSLVLGGPLLSPPALLPERLFVLPPQLPALLMQLRLQAFFV